MVADKVNLKVIRQKNQENVIAAMQSRILLLLYY